MRKFLLLVLLAFLSVRSIAQNEPQDLFLPSNLSNWVSTDYLDCLKNGLPCECEKSGVVFLIDLDTSNLYVNLYDGVANQDYNSGYLEKYLLETNYVLYRDYDRINGKVADTAGTIGIVGDTLVYIDAAKAKTTFVKFDDDRWRSYMTGNVTWLNQQLKLRGYPELEQLLKTPYLNCFCNWELGGVNLVSNRKKSWILEMEDNELVIYKWKNPPGEKSLELTIKKKEIKRLKW